MNASKLFALMAGLCMMTWGSCGTVSAQQTQKTNSVRLDDGAKPTPIRLFDDLDPSELRDRNFPDSRRPKTPNAGSRTLEEITMDGPFTFDRKISFLVSGADGSFNSYFYLNTQTGYSMMDAQAHKQWIPTGEGKTVQIMTHTGDFYSYIDSREGKYSMKMSSGFDGLDIMLMANSLEQEGFRRTGKKVNKGSGVPFTRAEYSGKDSDGNAVSLWLSDPLDIRLDNNKTYLLTGHFGLGYFTDRKTLQNYMVTGIESKDGSIFITANEKSNASFSGKGYTTMGDLMMGGMTGQSDYMAERMQAAEVEIAQIEDPQLRALAKKELEQMSGLAGAMGNTAKKVGETNDLRHLGVGMEQMSEEYSAFAHMLLQSRQGIRQLELNIVELKKMSDDEYARAEIKKNNCLISCNERKVTLLNRAVELEDRIRRQYKKDDDDDKRDEDLGKLYEETLSELNRIADCGCND
ncbi:BMFP domain-containing protein YqiC [Algoriphagus sp. 4150]|uniref:hypothetical protein n=1 Tax=Algoriphagus sp. 4150 TaxID=2817756 RepID=UPI00286334DD|nr:hypothetical protein [Algoriphagus sp. 4150]MDR7129768.1 BMFP domain-containing protein YqiC [Algoriphagus sp. 4150]